MSQKLIAELELKICEKTVECLLAAGFKITVNDGEEEVVKKSDDKSRIMEAVRSTDEDFLITHKKGHTDHFVRFIWGEGATVINDFSCALEDTLQPVIELSEKYMD